LDNATSPVTARTIVEPSIFVFDFRRKMALKLDAGTNFDQPNNKPTSLVSSRSY
jgi:hypothetical protein